MWKFREGRVLSSESLRRIFFLWFLKWEKWHLGKIILTNVKEDLHLFRALWLGTAFPF